MATVGRGADQYTVRFPDGLRDRIRAAAEANGRSINTEIVTRLEMTLAAEEAAASGIELPFILKPLASKMADLAKRVEKLEAAQREPTSDEG